MLETLRNGYVLPFYSEPTTYARPNKHSAQIEVEFVTKAVAELLSGGYIEKVPELPVVCSPLLWWEEYTRPANTRRCGN